MTFRQGAHLCFLMMLCATENHDRVLRIDNYGRKSLQRVNQRQCSGYIRILYCSRALEIWNGLISASFFIKFYASFTFHTYVIYWMTSPLPGLTMNLSLLSYTSRRQCSNFFRLLTYWTTLSIVHALMPRDSLDYVIHKL
jgi:hypothetical protein